MHPDSKAHDLSSVYSQIDTVISQSNTAKCLPGCNSCCSHYFKISMIEYFGILEYISTDSGGALLPYLKKYRYRAERIVKRFVFPESDDINIPGFSPCVFINENDGKCDIYAVRPTLCRVYGRTERFLCTHINHAETKVVLDAELPNISENIDYVLSPNGNPVLITPYPISYWLSRTASDGLPENPKTRKLYSAFSNESKLRFVEILLSP